MDEMIIFPILLEKADAHVEKRTEEIQADKHGNNREMVEFENRHLWYDNNEDVQQRKIAVSKSEIKGIRPAWQYGYSILCWGRGMDTYEHIVPMNFSAIIQRLKENNLYDMIEIS